jgi:hypothetical protein
MLQNIDINDPIMKVPEQLFMYRSPANSNIGDS